MSTPRAGGRVSLYVSEVVAQDLRLLAEAHPGWTVNALIREAISRMADETSVRLEERDIREIEREAASVVWN